LIHVRYSLQHISRVWQAKVPPGPFCWRSRTRAGQIAAETVRRLSWFCAVPQPKQRPRRKPNHSRSKAGSASPSPRPPPRAVTVCLYISMPPQDNTLPGPLGSRRNAAPRPARACTTAYRGTVPESGSRTALPLTHAAWLHQSATQFATGTRNDHLAEHKAIGAVSAHRSAQRASRCALIVRPGHPQGGGDTSLIAALIRKVL